MILTYIPSLQQNTSKQDDTERALRTAPKPKPKFDPITNQWVVKSWDGTVAGIQDGDKRQFDDLTLTTTTHSSNTGNIANTSTFAVDNEAGRRDTNNTTSTAQTIPESTTPQQQQQQSNTRILTPFARIDEVFPNSPASTAGIELNDLLLQFDTIDATNHENFSAIAKLLPTKEGQCVQVKVRRKREMEWGEVYEVKELKLEPRKWDGRGLLGCHITKYDEE